MKKTFLLIYLTSLIITSSFGQFNNLEKLNLDSIIINYLDNTYQKNNIALSTTFWNNGMIKEMDSFYDKAKVKKDSNFNVFKQIEVDLNSFFSKKKEYHFIKKLNCNYQEENETIFYLVDYLFNEGKETLKSRVVLISENKGSSWSILDYRIKMICDNVLKGKYK